MTQEVLRIADAVITSNSTTIIVLIIWLFSLHTLKYYVIGTYPCSVLLTNCYIISISPRH